MVRIQFDRPANKRAGANRRCCFTFIRFGFRFHNGFWSPVAHHAALADIAYEVIDASHFYPVAIVIRPACSVSFYKRDADAFELVFYLLMIHARLDSLLSEDELAGEIYSLLWCHIS